MHTRIVAPTGGISTPSPEPEPEGFEPACPPNFEIPTAPYLYEVRQGDYRLDFDAAKTIRCDYPTERFFGINNSHKRLPELGDPLVDSVVTNYLRNFFPDIRHRGPAGNGAHSYDLLNSAGPVSSRPEWLDVFGGGLLPTKVGIDEWVDYVTRSQATNGNPITWVTNQVSTDSTTHAKDTPAQLAAHNAQVAQVLKARFPQAEGIVYQLGNENDRFQFLPWIDLQMEPAELTPNIAATVAAIQAVDPTARFVAFGRCFDFTFKAPHPQAGQSYPWKDLYDAQMNIPGITDHGFHVYPDTETSVPWSQNYSVPYYLKCTQNVINHVGNKPFHITEFARRSNSNGTNVNNDGTEITQGSVGGGISCVDMFGGYSQIPQWEFANYHASHAGAWRLFQAGYIPYPIFWALYLAKRGFLKDTYASISTSLNQSGYPGGYDFRAYATGDGNKTSITAINRHRQSIDVDIAAPTLVGVIPLKHDFLGTAPGVDPDTDISSNIMWGIQTAVTANAGAITVTLPASSVNVLTLG